MRASPLDALPVEPSVRLSPLLPNLRSLNQYVGDTVFFRDSEDAPFTRGRLTLQPRRADELKGVADEVGDSLREVSGTAAAPATTIGTPPQMFYHIQPMGGDVAPVSISNEAEFGKWEICVSDNNEARAQKMAEEIQTTASSLGLNPRGFTSKDGRYWVELPDNPSGARFAVEFHPHFVRISYGSNDARFSKLSDRLIKQWGSKRVELSGHTGVSENLQLSDLGEGQNFTIAQDVSDPLSPARVKLHPGDVVRLRLLDSEDRSFDVTTPLTELLINGTSSYVVDAEDLSRIVVKVRSE